MADNASSNVSGFKLDPLIDSIEDVLEIRATAMRAWKEGRLIVEWSQNGVETKKQIIGSPGEILAETRRCLKLMDPGTHGRVVRQSTMRRVA